MAKSEKNITVNGKLYERLYDENGNVAEDMAMLTTSIAEQEKVVKEMEQAGLMEIIKRKGIKYYRTLEPEEPKSPSVPFNVLNF